MKKFINTKFILLVIVFFTTSCNDDILDFKDQNTYSYDTYFNTPAEIEKGAIAAYGSFYFNNMMGFKWPEMFDVLANESSPSPAAAANEVDIMAMYKYQFNNNTNPVVGYWRMLYKMILRSNLVIDKASAYLKEKGDNPIVKRSLGEVYFLRGWAYSQLAFYYGRVPLRLTYNQAGKEDAPRTGTIKEVWDVAEADFKQAKDLLPEVNTYSSKELGRATKGAAIGFLGKLYLYNKEYAKAESEFSLLEGKYSLLAGSKWGENFDDKNENNPESLFEVQFAWFDGNYLWGNFADPEGSGSPSTQNAHVQLYTWGDVGGWDNWKFQPMRVNDFKYNNEMNVSYVDPRASLTFYGGIGDNTILDNTNDGPQPFNFVGLNYRYKKYTNLENAKSNFLQSGINLRLMRYADVLLMRAECKLEADDIPACLSYINQVRKRIGAFEYKGNYNKTAAFDLLKRERQLEFMGEQVRFNDLKRWGILEKTINPELQTLFGIQSVEAKHYLFPIPQLEIDSNLKFGKVDNNWN